MLKLQNLEGHFRPLLPGLLASTGQQSQRLCTRQRKPAFPQINQLQLSKEASARAIPVHRCRGRTAARWPTRTLWRGEVKRPAPLANKTETRKRKVNKGSETREEPAGRALQAAASQSDCPAVPSFLQRPARPGGLGDQATLQLQQPLLRILENLKIGVSWEWPFFSCRAMVQTINRHRHKPHRTPEKKKGNKKVQKTFPERRESQGPKASSASGL